MADIVNQLKQLARHMKTMDDTLSLIEMAPGWRALYESEEIQDLEFEVDRIRDMLVILQRRMVFLLLKYRSPTIGTDTKFPVDRARLSAELIYIQPRLDILASKTIGKTGETLADL